MRSRNRIAVCVFAFLITMMLTGYDIRASVDTASDLPKVKKLQDERPVDMWKAQLSKYNKTSLTNYSVVGGKIGRDVNPFAYRPLEGDYTSVNQQPYYTDGYDAAYPDTDIYEEPAQTETDTVQETIPEGETVFVFKTYGSGNGLGLSKNGADCYAKYGGLSYSDILAHYYPGTQIMSTGNHEEEVITVGDISGTPAEILPMVVYSEMSAGAQKEALKALTVAVYSYIEYRGGTVCDLQTKADPPENITEAVSEVLGEALYYDGDIANALFCESSGGSTASYSDIYGEDIPYLTSVSCEYDKEYDSNYGIAVTLSIDEVREKLEDELCITLSDQPKNWIKITKGEGGYVTGVDIDGKVTLRGVDIMDIFELRSAKFTAKCKIKK